MRYCSPCEKSAIAASGSFDRIGNRQFGGEGALGLRASQENPYGLERVLDRIIDGGTFITAMCHAIGAFGVVARAVTIPIGFFDQSFERRRVTLAHKQIAGPLPTEHIACRVAPGCTTVAFITGEKIEKQAGVVKPPLAPPTKPKNIPKELFARIALHENVLARSMLIAESRGNSHPLHSESRGIIEKVCHFFG